MDAALLWKGMGADLSMEMLDLVRDDGLKTAILLSLFIDRRAEPDDILPDNTTDRRGWWADAYPDQIGDKYGSRLWLLSREKQLPSVLVRAKEYAEEALAWMLEDGVAQGVTVTTEVVRNGVLGIGITITKPDGDQLNYLFEHLWEAL